ncbi:AAA family ATPase [Tomitella fengzijianii]|uniref:Nuclease SbcCD subunit C n=1 Tax=Tomitella fengzijianii TaxID=2597660 RepID=A0A516X3D6_9ACTN|nr:SMC family ATPase [Tomitella fengzijianii]QDQ97161.1 SMC family ATPase [Tomitella fengzijianii]
MRLHSLEMTGFGPFADTQCVDFDSLGADGLFLLHGQTGAGKTTVLDAVAFALYGTVPGARQDGRRLRSDHAAPGLSTEVVLQATIGGRHLRIRRSPEYMRPKKRGEGTTKENAKATLEWLDGSGENLSRIDEIGRVVAALLGMSAEQFFQVVLLPQGEFAKFLKAETNTRASLLERLFDTARFSDVEHWFAERRREASAAFEYGRQAVAVAVDGLTTAAGELVEAIPQPAAEEADVSDDDGGNGVEADESSAVTREEHPVAWAESLRETAAREAAREAARTADELHSRRAVAVEARSLADRQRERANAQRRRADACAAVEVFDQGREARTRAAAELDAARRAEQAGWAERSRVEAESDRVAAVARRDSLSAGFAAHGSDSAEILDAATAENGDIDSAALESRVRRLDDELVRLDAAAEDEDELARLVSEQSELAERIDRAESKLRGVSERAEALPEAIKRAREDREQASQAATVLPAQSAALDAAKSIEAAALAIPGTQADREDRAVAVTEARSRYNGARERALDLRERRLNGMAAELAGELRDGEPCSVCGAETHPRPATAADGPVTQQDEDSATREVDALATRLDEVRRLLQDADTELAVQVQKANGVDADEAARCREAAGEAHSECARLADGLAAATDLLESLEKQRDGMQAELEHTQQKKNELDTRATGLRARIDGIQIRLQSAVGQYSGVRERAAQVRGIRTRAEELRISVVETDAAASALSKAEKIVADAAHAAGFDSVDVALAAVRPASRCAEIEAELAAAQEAVASARSVLAEPDIVAVAGLPPADVESAAAASADADSRLEAAVRAQDQARTRLTTVTEQAERVGKSVAALDPLREEHEWLSALADVMKGDGENSRRMSLRSYVLAARLEEVAMVASQRLRVMSGGRYEFVHTEATVKRERRGGLGLDILDANTGAVRPTSTLSGGETFMASLSLALGLADVVSEESGGIHLETLFIDEGFGTLDAETLDVVMGVLDELRDGGRAVGIVSHVAEMRHRIPSRLHVIKGEAGSSLQASSTRAG